MSRLLEVAELSTTFSTPEGLVRAVDGLSFHIESGETVALVGESGCGKSVTARSIMGLYTSARVSQEGRILFRGEDLGAAGPVRRAALRGGAMAMIFQEPMSSFDPLATIGDQMTDARLAHQAKERRLGGSGQEHRKEALSTAINALKAVGIPDPEVRIRDYPHRLSGGMLQRVLIAIALMNEPELLIADEPTTALDVTIQAQVLRLIKESGSRRSAGVLFITHDLGVVAEMADRVLVMYAGRIVEEAPVSDFYGAGPVHPYARGLYESRIRPDALRGNLPSVPGTVPKPGERPAGCCFAPRCTLKGSRCVKEEPRLAPIPGTEGGFVPGRRAACWLCQGGVQ